MVKLSCVGSVGLSFMGTLRATQIKHDWKSEQGDGEEGGERGERERERERGREEGQRKGGREE